MPAQVPAGLKAADLTRFIVRASQLETAKPVIAYWCEYWIVNQILSKGLHNGDAETLNYTTDLMDKLEQIKANNATNDAIVDDIAGQAYVEQFALETFLRADRTMKANKVTQQTAQTFQAAATFLELVNIWGPPDSETQAKIKYAKWNAVRIIKALKEGSDPNDSNPRADPQPQDNLPVLDPNDPEVEELEGRQQPRQATVEDAPDEQDPANSTTARPSSLDHSSDAFTRPADHPSPDQPPAFDPYPRSGFPYSAVHDDNVSPLEPDDRNGSVGGGYFPEVPTFTSETQHSTLPTAPPDTGLDLNLSQEPSVPPSLQPPLDFESFPAQSLSADPSDLPEQSSYGQTPPVPQPPPVQHPIPHSYSSVQQAIYTPPQQYPPHQVQTASAVPAPAAAINQLPQYVIDDVAIAKAQKHARWAISALNFEDAATAVKELREALKTLGAS